METNEFVVITKINKWLRRPGYKWYRAGHGPRAGSWTTLDGAIRTLHSDKGKEFFFGFGCNCPRS
jgi:hypothetical protein